MDIELRKKKLPIIRTDRLVIREINLDDISEDYVNWLNNKETTKFLEIRFREQTLEEVQNYIKSKLVNIETTQHFGVYDQEGNRLIGTVTLPTINWEHKNTDISFVIGHPQASNRGYATEALTAVVTYIFKVLNLEKIWAGYYDGHIASEKIFKKLGFSVEGRLRNKLIRFDGSRCDHILVGLQKADFHE